MKIKFIFLITLFVLTVFPGESFAFWGRKKKNVQDPPQNAYSILLQTNNTANASNNTVTATNTLEANYVPDALGRKPVKKDNRTAAQLLADTDKLKRQADKANNNEQYDIAIELYDKAIKEYSLLQDKYPDLQETSVKFNKKQCIYQYNTLLENLKSGKITVKSTLPSEEKKPGMQEENYVLKKAYNLMEQGNNGAARELLMRTLMNDPDNARIRIAIGVVQIRLQWYDDASYLLETLVSEHPENVNAHVVLAAAYTGLERYQDAVSQLQKALELDPMQKDANFDMAKLLSKTAPHEKNKISSYYTKAVELGAERDVGLDAFLQ